MVQSLFAKAVFDHAPFLLDWSNLRRGPVPLNVQQHMLGGGFQRLDYEMVREYNMISTPRVILDAKLKTLKSSLNVWNNKYLEVTLMLLGEPVRFLVLQGRVGPLAHNEDAP